MLGLGGGAAQLPRPRLSACSPGPLLGSQWSRCLRLSLSICRRASEWKFVTDFMFAKNGGLTTGAAIILGAIFGAAGFQSSDKTFDQRRQERMSQPKEVLLRKNMVASGIAILAVIFVPMVVGGLTNELFANVGLFVLLGLGSTSLLGQPDYSDLDI